MSATPTDQSSETRAVTLGDVLYADPAVTCVAEKEWLALVQAIAAGDQAALRVLFQKTYPLVFTYISRLTADRARAEELVLEVFDVLWCEAPVFDSTDGPVLGWIMRRARTRALTHASSQASLRRSAETNNVAGLLQAPAQSAVAGLSPDLGILTALQVLKTNERELMEAVFVEGLSYAEAGTRFGLPVGTVKTTIRSGLAKLKQVVQEQGAQS